MFEIATVGLGRGRIGLSPMPGRYGPYSRDLAAILAWGPDLVVSVASDIEIEASGAETLGHDLAARGAVWRHLPVTDFRAPCAGAELEWPAVAAEAARVIEGGGGVLVHCYGGCGRSGMVALRLMVEAGEDRDLALARLRAVRPCAVETAAQAAWAGAPAGLAAAAR